MASIPIHNETDYPLTDDMTQYIMRDTQEHFGEEVRGIRVQAGIERHAFNARTREVRYAFSPQDFGFGPTMPSAPEPHTSETPRSRRRPAQRDAETEEESVPASWEDLEEDMEPLETSLDSLDEGQEDEEDDDFFTLDDPVEDTDEDDEDNRLDEEDEEDA